MKLIIDITEQAYNLLNSDEQIDWLGAEILLECIARGTPYEAELAYEEGYNRGYAEGLSEGVDL